MTDKNNCNNKRLFSKKKINEKLTDKIWLCSGVWKLPDKKINYTFRLLSSETL